jgi:hypothetical protein
VTPGLTRIVLHTNPLDAILDIGQGTQTGNQPAISDTALLHVARIQVLQECGVFVYFMNPLDGLGNRSACAKTRSRDIKLVGSEVVETVAFNHFQVEILDWY